MDTTDKFLEMEEASGRYEQDLQASCCEGEEDYRGSKEAAFGLKYLK